MASDLEVRGVIQSHTSPVRFHNTVSRVSLCRVWGLREKMLNLGCGIQGILCSGELSSWLWV